MNALRSSSLRPHLRDEEALVLENAIRLAIDSIINVLYGVNSAKTHEFQRMVADRDKEIQRLERRLREIERELQVMRRQGCTCGLLGDEAGLSGDEAGLSGAHTAAEPQPGEQSRFEPSCSDGEAPAGRQQCEMSVSLGLFARPPSHVSSQSHESALQSSPSRMGLDQTCTSHSSDASGLSEAARNLPASPSSLVVKEEPCDVDEVLIKWEMSEERTQENPDGRGDPYQETESSSGKKKLDKERKKLREKPPADPCGHHETEGENLRNKKKSVPMSELPEEVQRLKRAAWRAASRRYYARKVARLQANPSRSGPSPHILASHYSQPMSFADRRRRTLISELPEESQTLQREAWRAASRRYYARKIARHQTDPIQFAHQLQNVDPSGDGLGSNGGGSHTNSGGIMCS